MASDARRGIRASASTDHTAPIRGRAISRRREAPLNLARPQSVPLQFPIVVGIVHWLLVQTVATLAYRFGTSRSDSAPFGTMPPPHTGLAHLLVDPLRQWDGLWYRLIAIEGYDYHSANAAFWPLFPWLMRGISNVTGMSPDVAGYLIANLAFIGALVLLYRLTALEFDEGVARVTVWAIALFPTAFFFSAVYTESPFLLFLVGSLYAARRGNWWLAGTAGALAALTRSYGMFLVLPLGLLFIQERGFYLRRILPTGASVAMPLIGPAIFSWHLDRVWGDPWAWRTVQEQWNRFSSTPFETLRHAFSQSPQGARIGVQDGADWSWLTTLRTDFGWATITNERWRDHVANSDTLELVCTLAFLVLAVYGLWKLPLYMSAYLLPGLIVPLFQPSSVHLLMSMPRFGLTLFPIFVLIGTLLNGKRWLSVPLAAVSTAGLVVLTIQFVQWYWVS